MGDQSARIRLHIDTGQAQNDLRLIDQQFNELGRDAQQIDVGGGSTDSIKGLIESQRKLVESLNGYLSQSASQTEQAAKRMEQAAKRIEQAMKRNADEVYQKKLKELEAQQKMLQAQLNSPSGGGSRGGGSTGGGGSSGSAGGSTGGGGSSGGAPSNPNDPNGLLGRLKALGGQLGKLTTVLTVGRAVYGYVSEGAQKESTFKSQAYTVFNRTGIYGSDFSAARANAFGLGSPYGYSAKDTVQFQGQLMSRAGFTDEANLTQDTRNLMAVSKAYGLDLSSVGQVAGRYAQTGTIQSGDQVKFANILATSIREANMTGREAEQLDVLEQINGTLEKNAVTVGQSSVTNALGLYNTLANSNEALKGTRGADVVSTMNEAITGGGASMDVLLGWGTKYKGVEGRWALEEAKAKGISDPENLKTIISNFEEFTGQDITSASGKLMLQNQFGLNPDQVNEIVKNADAIRNGTYADILSEAVEEGTGATDIDEKLQNYNDSEVSTEEQYKLNKENAQEAAGDAFNTLGDHTWRSWFNNLSTGWQSALGIGGAAAGGYGVAKGVQWGAGKIFKAVTGQSDDAAGAVGAAGGGGAAGSGAGRAGAGAGGLDDAARAGAGGLDDAVRAGAGGLDDAARAAGGLDDAVRGAAGGLDDAARGASKAASALGKVGKVLGILGTVAEVYSTAVDTKEALDKGDSRKAAEEVGSGLGSLGGGAAGAWGGAALGTAIFPGIGTAIGGIIGGIAGAVAGDAAGGAAGRGINDAAGWGDGTEGITSEQMDQITDYYDKVKKLYEEEGNNAAQKYTKNTVTPYLNSIGVSSTITDKYNWDVGKPDFMKDYEDGVFGGAAGSYAIGKDYVPYDNFPAVLHKGEAVLTAAEAKDWRSGAGTFTTNAGNSQDDNLYEYSKLIDEESDLLDRREKLYEKYADETAAVGDVTSDGSVESNNLAESKRTSLLERILNIFGVNTKSGFLGGLFGNTFTSSGGGAAGAWGGTGLSSVVDAVFGGNGSVDPNSSLAAWTSNMIHGHEGNYSSINWNDNGAVSVGKIQWHAGRAKSILQQIRDADPASYNAIIQQYGAQSFDASLTSDDNWSSHIVQKGSAEDSAMQALLGSEVGRAIQDAQMVADVQNYIDKGRQLGLTDPKALAFYADMVNQYGAYHDTINKVVVPEAVANGGSLQAIYNAAISHLSNYHKRRTTVFNELNGADFSAVQGAQDKATGVDQVPYDGYLIRAHKDETLLTAAEGKEWRERTSPQEDEYALGAYNTPDNLPPMAPQQPSQSSFNGELKITLGGAIQGLTPENQNQIVAALLQQIRVSSGSPILSQLGNALQRVPH